MDFESLGFMLRPTLVWEQQLPHGIEPYASNLLKEELSALNYPDLIVLPITAEGEERREWLSVNQYNDEGEIVHQSIHCYGATEHNFSYKGGVYLAILVNND